MSRNPQSQEDLVRLLESKGDVRNPRVREVLLATDRAIYVSSSPSSKSSRISKSLGFKTLSYWDRALGIGHRATISAPRMHARALELLEPHLQPGQRALDVGSGSGYLTACMGRLVGCEGAVVGVEHIPDLVDDAWEKLIKDDPALLCNESVVTTWEEFHSGARGSGPVTLVVGDGRLGFAPGAPYNAIHVGAAAEELPEALLQQLAPGGRMLCPVGPRATWKEVEKDEANHTLICVDKDAGGKVRQRGIMGVIFVALTDKEFQLNQQ